MRENEQSKGLCWLPVCAGADRQMWTQAFEGARQEVRVGSRKGVSRSQGRCEPFAPTKPRESLPKVSLHFGLDVKGL